MGLNKSLRRTWHKVIKMYNIEDIINNIKKLDNGELIIWWIDYLNKHFSDADRELKVKFYEDYRSLSEELRRKLYNVCKKYVFLLFYECLTKVRRYSSLSDIEKFTVYVHEMYKDSGDINIACDIWESR